MDAMFHDHQITLIASADGTAVTHARAISTITTTIKKD
jgi:hypothetical protein